MSAPESSWSVIAIDGPAASGKSTTAKLVARRLGFRHVDSGALYRAATALTLRESPDPDEWNEDAVLAHATRISLAPRADEFVALIDGNEVEEEIRGVEVTKRVPRVARMPRLREWVNGEVRRVAVEHDIVVDGRDIGSAVFPDARLKVFLVADPWERARRRLIQRHGRGPSDDEIAEETDRLVQRDARDAIQSAQAPDAVLIDTTYLSQEEQVQRIIALARAVTHRAADT